MDYQVAYDIQEVMYPGWWIFGVGILFFSVGLGIILFGDSKLLNSIIESSSKQRVVMPIIGCIFGALWIGLGIINYSNFANLRTAARDGSTEIVEGKVEQFVPMPYEGHAQETFIVNGRYFAYSDYDQTKGFNRTQSHGGPMKEGLQVRITHVDGSIVKLEIAK
jgi:hypothetical protein